jgi:SHO1 osmosensor
MPSFAALSTPSLRKMENGHGYGQRTTFSVGRIIGDPFALATISIAVVSRFRCACARPSACG